MKLAVKKMEPKKDAAVKEEAVVEKQTVDETSEENLRERRYLWTARAAAVVAVGSFCTNIILRNTSKKCCYLPSFINNSNIDSFESILFYSCTQASFQIS